MLNPNLLLNLNCYKQLLTLNVLFELSKIHVVAVLIVKVGRHQITKSFLYPYRGGTGNLTKGEGAKETMVELEIIISNFFFFLINQSFYFFDKSIYYIKL